MKTELDALLRIRNCDPDLPLCLQGSGALRKTVPLFPLSDRGEGFGLGGRCAETKQGFPRCAGPPATGSLLELGAISSVI